MNDQLLKAIAGAFKINADEWIAQLKDGDDYLPEKEVTAKVVQLITERVTAAKTDSRKSGQAEQNAKILKFVKSTGFENPENLQGQELLTAYNEWKDEQVVPPTGDTPPEQMDKDALLKLPLVREAILQAKQESGKGNEKLKADFEAYKSEVEKERNKYKQDRALDISKRQIAEALRKGNVNLKVDGLEVSEDARIDSIFDIIRLREKIGLDAKDNPVFLGDDGEQKKDEFGNAIPFSDVVIGYGKSIYGIATQNPEHGGANPPVNGAANGKTDYVPPFRFATLKEYDDRMMVAADPKERLDLAKSRQFHEQKAAGN